MQCTSAKKELIHFKKLVNFLKFGKNIMFWLEPIRAFVMVEWSFASVPDCNFVTVGMYVYHTTFLIQFGIYLHS